jgi:hypothetical protein
MRKLLSVVAVLLCTLGFSAAAPVHAQTAPHPSRTARAVLPYEGLYRGLDQGHRSVTFHYNRVLGITNFRVGHHSFPNAVVSGGRWHHTCHGGYCTRGHWHRDFYVTGYWNIWHGGGGDVFFEATDTN